MLIESVPGDPCAFHVLPFDSPRSQTTLIARCEDVKREWGRLLKRVILENYPSVIPSHAAQLLMSLGQNDHHNNSSSVNSFSPGGSSAFSKAARRQHSAPEYLERRKGSLSTTTSSAQDSDRRKSENKNSLKARLRKARKSSEGMQQRHRKTSVNNNSPEVSSKAPPTTSSTPETPNRLNISDRGGGGIDRKLSSASCPPTVLPRQSSLVKKLAGWRRKSEPGGMYPNGNNNNKLGESPEIIINHDHLQEASSISSMSSSSVPEDPTTDHEVTSSSGSVFEEQSTIPCSQFHEERRESIEEIVGQLVMQKREFQRILSKQRLAHLRRAIQIQRRQVRPEEEEEEEDTDEEEDILPQSSNNKVPGTGNNIVIPPSDSSETSSTQVQRTVSDPGAANVVKTKVISSRITRGEGCGVIGVRHTHSFNCPAAPVKSNNSETSSHSASALVHGDSGVFTTSSSSSSSEASLLPTLPAVWVRTQRPHFPEPSPASSKSGSLPRSFQMGQQQQLSESPENLMRPRPITIASDMKPGEEDGNFEEDHHHNVHLHPSHRIYRPTSRDLFTSPAFLQPQNTPSIKSLLHSVTARLKKNRHKKVTILLTNQIFISQ